MIPIRTYPDPVLTQQSSPVEIIDDELIAFADEMLETMYATNGVGLAGPQAGRNTCMLVYDVSEERDQPHVLINPTIVSRSGRADCEEGCLSLPGLCGVITRAECISVEAQDLTGKDLAFDAEELEARCIQHEFDHLEGLLIIHKMNPSDLLLVQDQLRDMEQRAQSTA